MGLNKKNRIFRDADTIFASILLFVVLPSLAVMLNNQQQDSHRTLYKFFGGCFLVFAAILITGKIKTYCKSLLNKK